MKLKQRSKQSLKERVEGVRRGEKVIRSKNNRLIKNRSGNNSKV